MPRWSVLTAKPQVGAFPIRVLPCRGAHFFRKGADFTAAMAFEFASTNLVVELGIIVVLLLAWQFSVAEFVGGPIMIVLLALVFRVLLSPAGRGRPPAGG